MSARNYLSAREKNSKFDCLPNINQQKFGYRPELPPLSANTSSLVNRNLNYAYDIRSFVNSSADRAGTPLSDFFSESETGTPDFRSEESDSSSGSALRRNTAEATKILADEWERIERTLYDEEGEKSTRPHIIEECKQWRQLHPQLRIVGKAIQLPEKKPGVRSAVAYDEVIAMQYSDYSESSENEERFSQSSTDVTPQNSPRPSICENLCDQKSHEKVLLSDSYEPKLYREKVSFGPSSNDEKNLPYSFCSLLHITPVQIRSPTHRKRLNQSILKSDAASSRWMRNSRPDSSIHCDRNSAKSFVSLDPRNYVNLALSASERNKFLNSRVLTARQRDLTRLAPLGTPEISPNEMSMLGVVAPHQYNVRKVSLPPLLLDEEKKKVAPVSSAKKHIKSKKSGNKSMYHLDRVRYN